MFTAELTIGNEYSTMTFNSEAKAKQFIETSLKNDYMKFDVSWDGNKVSGTATVIDALPVVGEIYEGSLKRITDIPAHRKIESSDKLVIFEERIRIIVNDYRANVDVVNGSEDGLDIPALLKAAFQVWN